MRSPHKGPSAPTGMKVSAAAEVLSGMPPSVPRSGSSRTPQEEDDEFPELADLAFLLDSRWRIPGIGLRFGVDAVAGLLPVVGDVAAASISAYIIWKAHRLGASKAMLAKMTGLVVIDTTVGAIPILGSLFDLFFKANNANVKMLRRHLAQKGRALPPPRPEQDPD